MQSGMRRPGVLISGGNGYVGMLLLSSLLKETDIHAYVLLRKQHTPENLLSELSRELAILGVSSSAVLHERVTVVPFESYEMLPESVTGLQGKIDEVIHAAGSVDYFDAAILDSANVRFTKVMLDVARVVNAKRFIFISTAFSCGYIHDRANEILHGEPYEDPTVYTASKRKAEYYVANSGLPFQILRPGIVIGDSRTGRYSGKRYGLYQFLVGTERLLCNKKLEELHAVVSDTPLQFIHQDMLQNAFITSWRDATKDKFINIVPRGNSSPSMRDLWEYWARECVLPDRINFYDHLDDVPMKEIDPRVRAFLSFASVNTKIASHTWRFSTDTIDKFVDDGMTFTDPSQESVTRCMSAFLASSQRCQRHLAQNQPETTSRISRL